MAFETQFDGQYAGLGITPSIADSTDTTITASVQAVTATFATVGGVQPTVVRGKMFVELKSLNVAAVLGAIELDASDGTNTETIGTIAAPNNAVAGQGGCFVIEFYCALAKITNIVSVTMKAVLTSNTNGVGRLRVLGGP